MTNVSPSSYCHFDDWQNCTPLPVEGCAIYSINLCMPPLEISSAWQILSAVERNRASAFKFNSHRDRYIQTHAVLRQILAYHVKLPTSQIVLQYNQYGKPSLVDGLAHSSIEFNLTHSGNQALVAVSRNRVVGVDIELIDQKLDFEKLAHHTFTSRECAQIFDQPLHHQRSKFYDFWTCKESFVKAVGMGLSLSLNQFEVELTIDAQAKILQTYYSPQDTENWTLCTLPFKPEYAAALTLSNI